jgi:hypothetical protein
MEDARMHLSIVNRLLLPVCMLISGLALAAESSVTISSPMEGAKLDAMAENSITYEVVQGPKGDHSHLYVDGEESAVLRQLKGSYKLPTLAVGEHNLCIKVVNKGHAPIGVEKCVKVMVQ